MTTYTLHLPPEARPGDPNGLDEAELVKDGFSWGAFFFTFLWFFFHRLWLAGLGVLAAVIVLNLLLNLLGLRPATITLATLMLSLLIGLEANSLRRWTYARHRRPAVDVVTAADRDEAEVKAFARWLQRSGPARPTSSSPAPTLSSRRPDPVIGLFPDAERPL